MQGGFRRLPILKPSPWGERSQKGWTSSKPSPWGEGGWPLGQTDEGTGLGIGLLYAGGFRRLRTAGYFAHGGSSSQSPLVSVSAWRRKLRPLPCSSSSRRTRCAGLRREGREISQNAPGDGSGWTLRVHIRPPYPLWPFGPSPPDRGSRPRTPLRGTRTCFVDAKLPARKI